ncbi:S-adenosyl-L-methionine-dependent methyltransferase [Parathielavia hyrcaniae]|uniref:S-adenosyl-L-methionine-dependent methyltransferase n=1 Tax=Parathielavia hyrcaniae TaxID=113614 RepID=A0AAN6QAU1_9PEZI|nr:S-adenosyl-L-methionine-dependent methyltransferase [Parathielavia hyrcaniae]
MSFRSVDRPLDDYQFTFESYLDDSARIEPDSNGHDVYDTKSLSDSIARSRQELGRTYHSYRAGSYHFPNDEPENERAEEQYEIMKIVMDGRLHLAPFSPTCPPRKVLDIATGTGTWAIEMGDKYPQSDIIGTDLSPIQPAMVPPNVRFFVEDSSDDWEYPAEFDFIHTRTTIACWSDMKKQIIQRAFDHLRPGGWLECQEIPVHIYSDDGTIPDDYGWLRWARDFETVSRLAHRQADVGPQLKDWMREVGFVDVQEIAFKIPLNGWPKDMRLKHVGMMWQRNMLEGLSAFSLGLFNRFLGKTVEEIELSLVDVRKSLFDRNVHAYHRLHVVWGRKPEAA